MFVIEETDQIGPQGDHKRVIDHQRNAWIQRVKSYAMGTKMIFKLVWGDKVIPFVLLDIKISKFSPDPTKIAGKDFIHWRITSIGYAGSAKYIGVEDYTFENEEERDEALQILAEAMMQFGTWYDKSDPRPIMVSYQPFDRERQAFYVDHIWFEET